MKKVRILALLCMVILTLAGCSKFISKSNAMDIAMKDLGLIQINVSDLSAELDKSGETASYKVTFVYASQDYTYIIDAETGEILSTDTYK